MNKRSVLKVLLVLVYVALVVLFFALAKERKSVNSVCYDLPCIRFCDFVNDTSEFFVVRNPITNVTKYSWKVVFGKTCENLKSFESDQFTFSSVSRLVRARQCVSVSRTLKCENREDNIFYVYRPAKFMRMIRFTRWTNTVL